MGQNIQENNSISSTNIQSSTLGNKKQSINSYLIIGILIFLGLITFVFYFRSLSKQAKKISSISISPIITITKTVTPTQIPLITLQIPIEENWIPYIPTCPALKQITIYHPDNWKIGYNGEEDISDIGDGTNNKANECQITFGYPVGPGGHQYRDAPGLYSYVEIISKLTQYKSLNEYFKENSSNIGTTMVCDRSGCQNRFVKLNRTFYITNIANRQWVKEIYKDKRKFRLVTLYKGRIYNINYYIDPQSYTDPIRIDASSSARLSDIGEEFINRLEFH